MSFGAVDLGSLVVRLNADISRFEANMSRMESRMKSSMDNVTRTATRAAGAISAAVAAVSVIGVKQFAEFESSFAGVRKTVEATESEYAKLQETFRAMATQIPINVNQINQVAEAAGQLGIQKENIAAFAKTMIDLGNSTNLSAEQAATELARFANIMQMPQDSFDKLGSTIVALGNNFATTEAEIVDMAMRLAGAAKTVGMTESQVIALSTALSSVGVESEMGGTAVSRLMIEMSKASKTGNESLEVFASIAGLTSSGFKQAFEKDAVGALQQFLVGLNRVKKDGGDVFSIIENLGLDGARLTDVMMRMSGASNVLSKAIAMGNTAWNENTALTEEARKRYETLSSRFTVQINRIKDAFISIGENLAPIIENILDKFDAAYNSTNGFKEQIQLISDVILTSLMTAVSAGANAIEIMRRTILSIKVNWVEWSDEVKFRTLQVTEVIERAKMFFSDLWKMIKIGSKGAQIAFIEFRQYGIQKAIDGINALIDGWNAYINFSNKFSIIKVSPIARIENDVTGAIESISKLNSEIASIASGTRDVSGLDFISNQLANFQGTESLEAMKEALGNMLNSALPSEKIREKVAEIQAKVLEALSQSQNQQDGESSTSTNPLVPNTEDAKSKWQDYFTFLQEQEKRTADIRLRVGASFSSAMMSLTDQLVSKNSSAYKAMFALNKAFSIAMATVNISKAISDGWAQGTTIYEKLAAVGIIIAETANIVSSIKSVRMGDAASFLGGGQIADGPRVGGVDGMGGKWAVVHPSEKIIDPKAGGKTGGNVYITNNAPVQVTAEQDESGNWSLLINEIKKSLAGDVRNKTGDFWKSLRETTTIQPLGA